MLHGLGELLVAVGVDLDEFHLAGPLFDRALEHRAELPTRTAPFGPEVDDHRDLPGALDHRAGECLLSDIHTGLSLERLCGGGLPEPSGFRARA